MDMRKLTPSAKSTKTDHTTGSPEDQIRVQAEAYASVQGLTIEKICKVTSKPVRGELIETKGATVFFRNATGSGGRVEKFFEL